jgi:hypothetical protein
VFLFARTVSSVVHKKDCCPVPWPNQKEEQQWNPKMYGNMNESIAENTEDNMRYYVSPGCNHTILGNPMFYTEVTSGYTVAEWLSQMVETGLTGLPHVLCEDCGAKPDYLSDGDFCDG